MKKILFAPLVVGTLLAGVASAQAQFNIETGTGLFAPSYRGTANTTWFGWGPGSFDGATDNELIDNPAPTLGTTTIGVTLNQDPVINDILSGSNNIYTGFAGVTSLTLDIPTSGTEGSGFTTIIVQGRALFGGFGTAPALSDIAGVSPTFVTSNNANGAGQFWAKYEIPGNATSYDLDISFAAASHTSIGELQIDAGWSASGYSSDLAVVPEPSTWTLLGLGMAATFGWMKRSRRS